MDLIDQLLTLQSYAKIAFYLIVAFNFLIIILLSFSVKARKQFETFTQSLQNRAVLLVFAHPDDETMFFNPMLQTFVKQGVQFHLLCLSTGNFYGEGARRVREMEASAAAYGALSLGIEDDAGLQDHMQLKWEDSLVSEKIAKFVEGKNIGAFVTFDERGITNHPNHISCYNGLVHYLKKNKERIIQNQIKSYSLDSFGPIAQYTLLLPMTSFYFKDLGFLNLNGCSSYRLMQHHESQFNLMRRLHTLTSSYTYYNSMTELEFSE